MAITNTASVGRTATRFEPFFLKQKHSFKSEKGQTASDRASLKKKNHYLDYKERPPWLQLQINTAFSSLASVSASQWDHNGKPRYNICQINEHALMKKLIKKGYKEGQRKFWALDVGGGDFQWSQALSNFINKDPEIPKDIKVHIIAVGAEGYSGASVEKTKLCKIHNFGIFKIEEIVEELKKKGFNLENKIDLIVSSWCFRHLVDPVGTFLQTRSLLRPQTGFLLMDGFLFLEEQQGVGDVGTSQMTQLALDTGDSFLTRNYIKFINHYVFQKLNIEPCQLPMRYLCTIPVGKKWSIQSKLMLKFHRESQEKDQSECCLLEKVFDSSILSANRGGGNDKKLYDWLMKNNLLEGEPLQWRSLQKDKA